MVANSDGSTLIYTDYNGGAGVNRNCLARIFNKTDSPQSLYNQSVDMQKIFTVAGNYALGCNTWDGATYNNQQATAARMHYPVGITALEDNSEMYISDRNAHCIFKVNDGGTLSEHVGQCTSAGDISGPLASAKLTYPGDLQIDSDATYAASGNFFLVDRWITTLSSIKYVNLSASSVDIFGVIIGPGEIGKVISTDGYGGAVASFGNQICYSQGANANAYQYPHNVYCVDRSTGITTLRVGKISASVTKAATPHYDEEEGVIASSSSLSGPWGITFDSEGNLYIAEYYSNNIRMVKRWF